MVTKNNTPVTVVNGVASAKAATVSPNDTLAALVKQMEQLKAENEALKARSQRTLSMKVSEKGALSVYGMGRFPVTLYKTQWERLLSVAEDIKTFIAENGSKLAVKE